MISELLIPFLYVVKDVLIVLILVFYCCLKVEIGKQENQESLLKDNKELFFRVAKLEKENKQNQEIIRENIKNITIILRAQQAIENKIDRLEELNIRLIGAEIQIASISDFVGRVDDVCGEFGKNIENLEKRFNAVERK